MLAFWSPVFENMFTSEFQEMDANEVPVLGKNASEIKEQLLLIYPSLTEREITEGNCYFLFKLAHEYQMEAIVTRCEDFMAEKVNVHESEKRGPCRFGFCTDLRATETETGEYEPSSLFQS